jgi:hypothetical protein
MGFTSGGKYNRKRRRLTADPPVITSLLLSVIVSLWGLSDIKAETLGDEYSVKGAYLLNFAKFTSWREPPPRTSERKFTICTWKTDPLKKVTAALESKTVFNLAVKIKVTSTPEQINECDILFIPLSESADLSKLLPTVNSSGTLLVSEEENSAMITFLVGSDGQIRFSCNLLAAGNAGVKFSSQLISLAVHVREG